MKQTLRGVDFFVLYYQQQLRKGDTSCELETVALSYDTMHTGVNGQKGGVSPLYLTSFNRKLRRRPGLVEELGIMND